MSNFLISLGILNSIFVVLAWTWIAKKEPNFNFRKNDFSTLGGKGKQKKTFNLIFLAYSLIEFVFLFELTRRYGLFSRLEIPILLLITPTLGVLTATKFDTQTHRIIHKVFAIIGFSTAVSGAILFAITILPAYPIIGWSNILFLLIASTAMIFGLLRHGNLPAVYEYLFFGGAIFWTISNSIPLFFK